MREALPRIGVTHWEDVLGERIESYWERIAEAGGEPVDLRGAPVNVDTLDALVLTGGYDVDPARYGAERHSKVKHIDPERDEFELTLLRDALARDLPVLAICRGHQVLNVAFGGTLLQHIEDGSHVADYKTAGCPSRWHSVRLAPESHLRAQLATDEVEVNSRHHQAVTQETLAAGLAAVGTSPDGLIEAVESLSHRWVVGVQWHPERLEPEHPEFAPRACRLFEALVREAQEVMEHA
ncbi:MAG: type 1 glutamine amidotransferase [Dehalococcoidia bacterium]